MSATIITNRFTTSLVFSFAAIIVASSSFAQSDYQYSPPQPFHQPTSPLPVEFGFSQHHSSTAAEGFLRGKSALIQALGNFELSDSQAQILWQQARSLSRDNDLKQTEALQAQKKMWSDARIQERTDRNARIAAGQQVIAAKRATVYRAAYRLSAGDLNVATGAINWPAALQNAKYQPVREQVEELFRQHASYGSSQSSTATEISRSIDSWTRTLRSEVGSMPREDYAASVKFLLGLKFAAEGMVQG
jgi:hypothetical protein